MTTDEIGPWSQRVKDFENQWFEDMDKGVTDTYAYRYFDDTGRLLYVGQTANPKRRDSAHKSRAAWFPLVATRELRGPMTKARALAEEFMALNLEDPIYNHQTSNGYTGPGSDQWAQAMSDKFRELMFTEPEIWEVESAILARRMTEFFAAHDVALPALSA